MICRSAAALSAPFQEPGSQVSCPAGSNLNVGKKSEGDMTPCDNLEKKGGEGK